MMLSRPALLLAAFAAVALPLSAANTAGMPAGVPNFHVVNAMILRGGQPTAAGWQSLSRMGVRTVIDLCEGQSALKERAAVEAAGMTYINIPMSGHGIAEPDAAKVAQALAVLNAATAPVFIHCHKGSDRTGTIIACYRIEHDHWAAAKAQKEADKYGMSWLNVGMKRFIGSFNQRMLPIMASATPAVAGGE